MDPLTLAMVALTVVATKATEKVGEELGVGVVTSARRLLDALRRRSPETVLRLEAASDPTVIDAEIVEEVQRVAKVDSQVQAAMQETVAAVQADQRSWSNLTKLAERIGVVQMGAGDNIAGDKVMGDKIGTQINHNY
jgi:hypothetical protein